MSKCLFIMQNVWSELSLRQDFLYQPHYRDRLHDRIFKSTQFEAMFKSWEGGHLVMWRWSSLVDCLRALKRRQGPLQMFWDENKYMSQTNLDDENQSRAKAAKNEQKENTSWSRGDAKRFSQIIGDVFFWAYLESWSHLQRCGQ